MYGTGTVIQILSFFRQVLLFSRYSLSREYVGIDPSGVLFFLKVLFIVPRLLQHNFGGVHFFRRNTIVPRVLKNNSGGVHFSLKKYHSSIGTLIQFGVCIFSMEWYFTTHFT